ncbi:hypothetical protein HMN09_00374000 [Mycena chlorophos]|uniref:CCHC-type domain-containing protein n=1 Tax=Mycena chlorophos TaxID=658473 RepID=A0A8H6TKX9_MYCCL|nr:hypothetical protein HMN09_00374000 [Mycena chlorophos]
MTDNVENQNPTQDNPPSVASETERFFGLDMDGRSAFLFEHVARLVALTSELRTENDGLTNQVEDFRQRMHQAGLQIDAIDQRVHDNVTLLTPRRTPERVRGRSRPGRRVPVGLLAPFGATSSYKDDVAKIATTWSKPCGAGAGTGAYTTWASFEKDFIATFKGGAQVELAQQKIENLRQGSGTATTYFTALDALNKAANFDDVALIRILQRGLNRNVVAKVYTEHPLPDSYDKWKASAQQQDALIKRWQVVETSLRGGENAARQGPSTTTGRNPTNARPAQNPTQPFPNRDTRGPFGNWARPVHTSTSAPTTNAPVPMEVDRAASNERQVRRITCYRCGKEGHIGRNCPDNMTPAQIRALVTEVARTAIQNPINEGPKDGEAREDFPNDRA